MERKLPGVNTAPDIGGHHIALPRLVIHFTFIPANLMVEAAFCRVFIPIAEESGAIVPLGYWVLEQVCNESLENGLNRKVSVNISPVQLRHRSFIEKVREILMRTAYPVSLLEFEVTE